MSVHAQSTRAVRGPPVDSSHGESRANLTMASMGGEPGRQGKKRVLRVEERCLNGNWYLLSTSTVNTQHPEAAIETPAMPGVRATSSTAIEARTESGVRAKPEAAIEDELTITMEDHTGQTTVVLLYRRPMKGWILVPRLYGYQIAGAPTLERVSNGIPIDPVKLTDIRFHLHDDQVKCVEYLRSKCYTPEQMRDDAAGCILNLACGKGKTHVGIQRIVDVGRRTIIVCHSNVSASQWVNSIQRSLPLLSVAEFHGSSSATKSSGGLGGNVMFTDCCQGADVVVATIHPLVLDRSKASYDQASFKQWISSFGQVIYDEIHIFGAPKFSAVFDLIAPRTQLGLSATPDRIDGMEKVYTLKVGPVVNAEKELRIAPPRFQVTVHPIIPPVETPTQSESAIESVRTYGTARHNDRGHFAEAVKLRTLDPSRIKCLIGLLHTHFSHHPHDNAIVFCNFIEEVELLQERLSLAFQDDIVGSIYGDLSAMEVGLHADLSRILICTYKKGGTAFSPVRFRVAVIWSTTRAMIKQAVGRIQRWRDEENVDLGEEGSWNVLPRTIYDFIDRGTVFRQQYYCSSTENDHVIQGRRKVYVDSGYVVLGPEHPTPPPIEAPAMPGVRALALPVVEAPVMPEVSNGRPRLV